jgi:ribosomal protein L16/L10AE
MSDEKQMNAIRFFCEKPYSDHGLKQRMGKGRDYHEWSDLIQQISYFDFGHTQKDEAMVQTVAKLIRVEFPDGKAWNKIVKIAGSHEKILTTIRSGLAALLPVKPKCA